MKKTPEGELMATFQFSIKILSQALLQCVAFRMLSTHQRPLRVGKRSLALRQCHLIDRWAHQRVLNCLDRRQFFTSLDLSSSCCTFHFFKFFLWFHRANTRGSSADRRIIQAARSGFRQHKAKEEIGSYWRYPLTRVTLQPDDRSANGISWFSFRAWRAPSTDLRCCEMSMSQ